MLCVLVRLPLFSNMRRRGSLGGAAALLASLIAVAPASAETTLANVPPAPAQADIAGSTSKRLATTDLTAATRIAFASDAVDLSAEARRALDGLVAHLGHGEAPRLELIAHAGAGEADHALRVSLSRALVVRSYLVEHGIHSSRLDARALGNRSDDGGPGDRVDIVMLAR
jgi:outer membrane protein OmpA-like peptidoglycan-associated protein